MQVHLASPRGFCAGVDRAIEIVDRALEIFGSPVYVRHEVVHNRYVVDCLRERGAVFVDELEEVPDNATVIFSAHGVPLQVQEEAARRQLRVFDATCPLVTKVHMEVARHARKDEDVILIGHTGHPEVEGTLGQYRASSNGRIMLVESVDDVAALELDHSKPLAYVTQTTLSVDDTRLIIEALQQKFPHISGPKKDDICYATQNRQDAVRELASRADIFLVIGSANSSNSNRLRELAESRGIPAYLIDGRDDIEAEWFEGKEAVAVTAGASAPELLVEQVMDYLQQTFAAEIISDDSNRESIRFQLPKELRNIEVRS